MGKLRRGGMVQRTAHRAGRTILEHLRQNACLLVQKGPVFGGIEPGGRLRLRCRCLISALGLFQRTGQRGAIFFQSFQFLQGLGALLGQALAVEQLFFLRVQGIRSCQSLPAGPDLLIERVRLRGQLFSLAVQRFLPGLRGRKGMPQLLQL